MGHPYHDETKKTLRETFRAVKGKTLVHKTGTLKIKTVEDFSLVLMGCIAEAFNDKNSNLLRHSTKDEITSAACEVLKKKIWLSPGP